MQSKENLQTLTSQIIKITIFDGVLTCFCGLINDLLASKNVQLRSYANCYKNKRKESVSTSVHGVQALIVKPSQSLSPMLGVWLLSRNGLHNNKNVEKNNNEDQYSIESNTNLQHAIFLLMFGVPLICTICQYVYIYIYI